MIVNKTNQPKVVFQTIMKHTSVKNKIRNKERTFSVELGAKEDLRTFSLSNDSRDNVLIEGTLGELVNAGFRESTILEIAGRRGVLRIDLQEKELVKGSRGRTALENLNDIEERADQNESQGAM